MVKWDRGLFALSGIFFGVIRLDLGALAHTQTHTHIHSHSKISYRYSDLVRSQLTQIHICTIRTHQYRLVIILLVLSYFR